MRGASSFPLRLDHASVAVADLGSAVEHLDRRLGLSATVSPTEPGRHSRIFLDRSYLEVSVQGERDDWAATMFFLRFEDPLALRAHLDAVGIAHRFTEYTGVDGTWDDVEVEVVPSRLCTLIRRTEPPEVARDWPPALAEPHRCGAQALAAVHLEVPSLAEAVEGYARLLGGVLARQIDGTVRVPLTTGELVLREGASDRIVGVVLAVASLDGTRSELGDVLGPAEHDVAWLDPRETFGLRFGFAEIRAG